MVKERSIFYVTLQEKRIRVTKEKLHLRNEREEILSESIKE